jgi:ketosteroid isomerase-like protein
MGQRRRLSLTHMHARAERWTSRGELAYSTGTYTLSFNDPAGKGVTDRGKYATVWRKQGDGSWKVVIDVFNSDLPLPSAARK